MFSDTLVFSVLVCMIPLLSVFAVMLILVKEFKALWGILSIFLGFAAVIPITAAQLAIESHGLIITSTLTRVFLKNLLICGLIEESIKMALMFILPSKKIALSGFFACALTAGLSLGCFETLAYLVIAGSSLELRMLTAVVIHTCCAGLSGLFVYSVKTGSPRPLSLILAIVLHGLYNYFAGFKSGSFFFWFSFVVVVISAVECRIRYRSMIPEGLILFQ